MEKCLRCGEIMVDDLNLVSDNLPSGLQITNKEIFPTKAVKPKVRMCVKCGYVELYTNDIEKAQKFSK